ncbi:MAG: S-layer homology domain-containing protein, partial [Chloroflexota bacterium]|nr:S-layer homology domain-containing protein [Chloroflexota bacterium]
AQSGTTHKQDSQQVTHPSASASCDPPWVTVPSPNMGDGNNSLSDIAVASADDIWALGSFSEQNVEHAYILHWDGAAWTIAHTTGYPYGSALPGITIVAPDDVWAVGKKGLDSPENSTPLALHWDGTSWSEVPVPQVPGGGLNGVDGSGSDDIWAVGSKPGDETTLFMHWNGSSWTQFPSSLIESSSGKSDSLLYDIAVVSPVEAWAVGRRVSFGALVYRWDGVRWANMEANPFNESAYSSLADVVAFSSNNVWVGGYRAYRPGENRPELSHWDGVYWDTHLLTNEFYGAVTGLAAISPNEMWAVGNYYDQESQKNRPFLLHYQGHWPSIQNVIPTAADDDAYIAGAAAVSSDDIWAVGLAENRTHVERYRPPFSDVYPEAAFYTYIQCLACKEIVSGYGDHTFRPNSPVTRGQISKILSNSVGYSDIPESQTFADVPPGSPFYDFVERMASRAIISGYQCGAPGEACDSQNRPYFRPNSTLSRGQLAKLIANVKGYNEQIPDNRQTFSDVPPHSTFWVYVERAAQHYLISGYGCGERLTEPCPGTYYRPSDNVTRGQTTKVVGNAFFPECANPTCWDIPPSIDMTISPAKCARAGSGFNFKGKGFQPGEKVSMYVTAPDGSVIGANFQIQADESGNAGDVYFSTTTSFPQGIYVATMEGGASNKIARGYFKLLAP